MSSPLRMSLALLVLNSCHAKVDAPAPVVETPAVKTETTAQTLEVTVLPGETVRAGGPVELRMRVHNPTAAPLRFCRYHTLFEGLRNDLFEVTGADGGVLDYRGMMAKRAPPGPQDFLTVAPGATLTSDAVDVSEGYAFPAGRFTVVFGGGSISGLPRSAPLVIEVK